MNQDRSDNPHCKRRSVHLTHCLTAQKGLCLFRYFLFQMHTLSRKCCQVYQGKSAVWAFISCYIWYRKYLNECTPFCAVRPWTFLAWHTLSAVDCSFNMEFRTHIDIAIDILTWQVLSISRWSVNIYTHTQYCNFPN